MTNPADQELLRAVLEPRKEGALEQITKSCAAGADPNGICPEGSTSRGYVRAGSTLLTHAIHEGSFRAVDKLLDCGADPNLKDQNGWTPWMASTLVDESPRSKIQASLIRFGARTDGEHIGQLARAIFNGDVDQALKLLKSDRDFEVLSSFRVDLVGCQIANNNARMLELLLEGKMPATSTHLINAIRRNSLSSVDLLLRYGLPPECPDEDDTPLMTAAGMGNLEIVQRLVEAGADVNRCDHDDSQITAAWYAENAGNTEVAEWLNERMNKVEQ